MSNSQFQAAGKATVAAAQGLGYDKLVVLQAEDGKLLGSF
jgi:hypothetical protein